MDNMTHGYEIWKINRYILNEAYGYSSKCHTHWEKCMNSFLTTNHCNIQTMIFCHMTQWIGTCNWGEIVPKVGRILCILIGENFLPPLTNGCFSTPYDLHMFKFTIPSPCTLQWVKPSYWRHSQNACRVESMNIISF
jgi:hypothetical protein